MKKIKNIETTEEFENWVIALSDSKAKSIIEKRIYRVGQGNYGDYKSVGDGVLEMRIHYGAGYRIYFVERGKEIIVLLAGGTKSGQNRDIKKAIEIAKKL